MNKVKCLNTNILKIIAIITMIVDHMLKMHFLPNNIIFIIIGRIAFPIFAFCVSEGILHTHNKMKYMFTLFLFALLSEIPMDYALYGGIDFSHQNVLFTFFIAVFSVISIEQIKKFDPKGVYLYGFILLALSFFVSLILSVDYSFLGVFLVLGFYFSNRYSKTKKMVFDSLFLLIFSLIYAIPLEGFSQIYGLAALPFILLYNGERGKKNNIIKYIFYLFYPVHFLILILLKGGIL